MAWSCLGVGQPLRTHQYFPGNSFLGNSKALPPKLQRESREEYLQDSGLQGGNRVGFLAV